MVHIPLLGIDVPEPRLDNIISSVFEVVLHAMSRLLDASQDIVNPLSPDAQTAYDEAVISTIAPEFLPVMQRFVEGKILDSEQLSSEADEASFDFYRRGIRESMIGLKGEGPLAKSLRRLGADRMTPQEEAWLKHYEQASASDSDEPPVLDVRGLLLAAEQQEQAQALMTHAQMVAAEQRTELLHSIWPGHKQAAITALNASVGVGLGLSVVRGVGFVLARLLRRRQQRLKRLAKARRAASGSAVDASVRAPAAAEAGPHNSALLAQTDQQQAGGQRARPRVRIR